MKLNTKAKSKNNTEGKKIFHWNKEIRLCVTHLFIQ